MERENYYTGQGCFQINPNPPRSSGSETISSADFEAQKKADFIERNVESLDCLKKEIDFSQFSTSYSNKMDDEDLSEKQKQSSILDFIESLEQSPTSKVPSSSAHAADLQVAQSSLGYVVSCQPFNASPIDSMIDLLNDFNKPPVDQPRPTAALKKKRTATSSRSTLVPFHFKCDDCSVEYNPICRQHSCQTCHQRVGDYNALICKSCKNAHHIACLVPPLVNIFESWSCVNCQPPVLPEIDQGFYTGKVPGILVGSSWSFRVQMSNNYLHRPSMAGIHGGGMVPAYSIVLQGGYEKDEDNGYEFYYTGAGGRDARERHIKDQELTATNFSLAASCDTSISLTGAQARDWRKSSPIRVIRGPKLIRHAPQYAPLNFRYDGLYKVVSYWKETIEEGFFIWRFHLRRDDIEPAPWTPEGEEYIKINNISLDYMETTKRPAPVQSASPKIVAEDNAPKPFIEYKRPRQTSPVSLPEPKVFNISPSISALQPTAESTHNKKIAILDPLIALDVRNQKFWERVRSDAHLDFVQLLQKIREEFNCVICSDLVELAIPYTTTCGHTFCRPCFRGEVRRNLGICPKCKTHLPDISLEEEDSITSINISKIQINEALANILLILKPALDEDVLQPSDSQ